MEGGIKKEIKSIEKEGDERIARVAEGIGISENLVKEEMEKMVFDKRKKSILEREIDKIR